jgi:hypothetical protein
MPSVVEIQSGGTIEPGDGNIASFTVSSLNLLSGSTVNMEINKTLATNDKISATGAIAINGKLNLTITGVLSEGDQFTLFTGSGFSGSFTQIVPATPGDGLEWQFANGILKVVKTPTGIHTVKNTPKPYISPNPILNTGILNLGEKYKETIVRVETLLGTCVYAKSFTNVSNVEIDMDSFTSGIYIINMIADGKKLPVCRVIKK